VSPSFEQVRRILIEGREAAAFPAATIEVGRAAGPIWSDAIGSLRYTPGSPACTAETIFDLASLTKVLVTTPLAMRAVGAGQIALETPVAELSRHWRGSDRESVTLRHLLDHSSGLPAHLPLWREIEGPGAFERAIGQAPLAYESGHQSVYSDLGFILLGAVLPRVTDVTLEATAGALDAHDAGGFI
jgi:CubicO group peptidase (beta-lactamase class C family)